MAQEHIDRINIWILTGCLGAGKTTVLNHILRDGGIPVEKSALIINDFGSINIDSKLIENDRFKKYEINKGSIFCVCTKTDFIKALTDISSTGQYTDIFIEATGVAQPADIAQFITDSPLEELFTIRANICVVDAYNFTKVAPFMITAKAQAAQADAIVINKTDMVSDDALNTLKNILQKMNNRAVIKTCCNGCVDFGWISHIEKSGLSNEPFTCRPEGLNAVSIQNDKVIDRAAFSEMIKSFGEKIVRFKGNVNFADGLKYVEIVFDKYTEGPPNTNLPQKNSFTVIGWGMSKEELKEKFSV